MNFEVEHPQREIVDRLVEALAGGDNCGASNALYQLEGLERGELNLIADLLGKRSQASINIFPWSLRIVYRRRGKPVGKDISKAKTKAFGHFLDALNCNDVVKAVKILRKMDSLCSDEVKMLADLMDAESKTDVSLAPVRLKLTRHVSGRPRRPLEEHAMDFLLDMSVRRAGLSKIEAAIAQTQQRTGMSRARIQRARQNRK